MGEQAAEKFEVLKCGPLQLRSRPLLFPPGYLPWAGEPLMTDGAAAMGWWGGCGESTGIELNSETQSSSICRVYATASYDEENSLFNCIKKYFYRDLVPSPLNEKTENVQLN